MAGQVGYAARKNGYKSGNWQENSRNSENGGKYNNGYSRNVKGQYNAPQRQTKAEQRQDGGSRSADKPTEKQINYARSLAKEYCFTIPKEAYASKQSMSEWLDEHLAQIPPTEKQIAFLENLANSVGVELPEEAYNSRNKCSEYIDNMLQQLNSKNPAGQPHADDDFDDFGEEGPVNFDDDVSF